MCATASCIECLDSSGNISVLRTLFRRAQVFAIISICVYGLAALLGFIALCCCSCLRWVCLALNIAGVATLCVVWASIVLVYYETESPS
nr:unnamed protein product [Leishmania braziliensis]